LFWIPAAGPKEAGSSDSVNWPLLARYAPMARRPPDPWWRRIGVRPRWPGAATYQNRPQWRTMGSPRRGQSRARWAIIRQVTAVRVCVSVCLTRCPRWLCLGGAARRARRESDRHSPGRCRHERSADRPASKVRKPETHHNGLIGALDRRNPATSPHARNRSARNHLRARGPSGNPEFVRRMIIIIQGLEHLAPLSGRPGSQGLLDRSYEVSGTRVRRWPGVLLPSGVVVLATSA
jgi:hypothetical protein